MLQLDTQILRDIAPVAQGRKALRQNAIIAAVAGVLTTRLSAAGIDTCLRIAHFLAQICHESDGFCTTVEYASGLAYEGRADLGNNEPGDGPRFKGRGLIQLTGRANYATFGALTGLDLVGNPDLAADPLISLQLACAFWARHRLNDVADRDDLESITRIVNGRRMLGLANRAACLARAKSALAHAKTIEASVTTDAFLLRQGATGDAVADLQTRLRAAGQHITIDGVFGPLTLEAVMQFQKQAGIHVDGIAGPQTRRALAKFP